MKLLKAIMAICVIASLGQAQAAGKKKAHQSSGHGYGMAGCGLGGVILGEKRGLIQIFAASLNEISANQIFGISSGTLNCGESGKSAKAEQFIEVNKVALQNDIARGQGETLTSLSQVLECKNGDFTTTLKSNYQQAFPSGGASAEQMQAVAYQSCQI